MPRVFVAEAPDPSSLFPKLSASAQANGFVLRGDSNSGMFSGTPSGLAGALIGEISGTYSVSGTQVTIRLDKDLPSSEVDRRLAQFGIRLVG